MYNPQLDTFLITARCGSFTAASKQLYISPSAILQQINSLESNLGVTLFIRTKAGLRLTPAGEHLVHSAEQLKTWNKTLRSTLYSLDNTDKNTLRVGVPKMHKSRCFYELWTKYSVEHHNLNIDFCEAESYGFTDNAAVYSSADLIEFIHLPDSWQDTFGFLKLGDCSVLLNVPRPLPLSNKPVVTAEDIAGKKIIVNSGPFASLLNDYLNVLSSCGAHIELTPNYSPSLLERCYIDRSIILLPSCSSHVHPGLIPVHFQEDFKIPYGFVYSPKAAEGKNSFIEFVKREIASGDFVWTE